MFSLSLSLLCAAASFTSPSSVRPVVAGFRDRATSAPKLYSPFLDSAFGVVPAFSEQLSSVTTAVPAEVAPATLTTLAAAPSDMSSLFVGLFCYALTMVALSLWDALVVPNLQEKGMLPYYKDEQPRLSVEDRKRPWLRPADLQMWGGKLPTIEEVVKQCVRIGKTHTGYGSLEQYLCAASKTDLSDGYGECELSDTWSDHYGREVWICKRKVVTA